MILHAYRAIGAALQPLGPWLLRRRLNKGKEDPERFQERLGRASILRPDGPLIWLHAASVGEAQSILGLIHRLATDPDAASLLVTSGTVTSARLLAGRLPKNAIHQYSPIDLPAATGRFIAHWRPDLAIWTESELWPNLIRDMAETARPMVLINGRMSDRSYRRWRQIPGVSERLLSRFSLVLAQNEDSAERFRDLGAPEVRCEGNLKYAAEPLPANAADVETLKGQISSRPFWIAASIHPGEDEAVGTAHTQMAGDHPGLLTILAPRHPARADAMAVTLKRHGLATCRRSLNEPVSADVDVYITDTIGELGILYRLNAPVFVGGSLVPHGGQNMLEPSRFGRCILTGPHTANFNDVVKDMRVADALIEIETAEELAAALSRLLSHADEAAALGTRAEAVAAQQSAVLERVLTRLAPLLPAR